MNSSNKLALFAGFAAYCLFTVMDTIIKHVSSNGNSIFMIIFLLNLFSFIYYCALFLVTKWKYYKTTNYKFHLSRGVVNILVASTIMYSFSNFSLNYVYAVIFAAPFFNTLLGMLLLRDKVNKGEWVSILFGLGGVLAALRPWNEELTLNHGIVFCGALMISVSSLMLKHYGKDEKPLTISFYSSVMLSIFYGGLAIFHHNPISVPDLSLVAGAGLLMASASLCVTYGLLNLGFATMGSIHYTQLIWGAIMSYLVFNEIQDAGFFIGAGLIVFGGLLNSVNRIIRAKWM